VLWRLGLPLDALDEQAEQRPVTRGRGRRPRTRLRGRSASRTRQPAAYLTGEACAAGRALQRGRTRAIVPRSLIAELLAEGTHRRLAARRPPAQRAGPVHRQRQPGRCWRRWPGRGPGGRLPT
jgi:hypothetical protein